MVLLKRAGYKDGGTFTIKLLLCEEPRCSDKQRKELIQAIKVFGPLGGIGARARRGGRQCYADFPGYR